MAKDMNPPFSKAVVSVADAQVDGLAAAGWTEVKQERKPTPRKTADKK